MSCQTEIHSRSYGDIMDLHCFNKECLSNNRLSGPIYKPFMKVLADQDKKWICLEYGFPFYRTNDTYVLYGKAYMFTALYTKNWGSFPKSVIETSYIDISTDNDMHIEAHRLFNRLYNLISFS